jgi:Putative prokaryotic signal transducing protein
MTTIRSFTNQAEASLCASFLQANEFDAVLLDEAAFQCEYGGMAIPIRLQVPREQAAAAVALLQSTLDEERSEN